MPKPKLFAEPVVFVDIETTGGTHRNSRILEICAITYHHGRIVDSFTSLINPGTSVPRFITAITGITNADIKNAPSFEAVAEQLYTLMSDHLFIAHNVMFDYSFIRHQFQECGLDFQPELLCTVKLSRALYPQYRSHSLKALIQRHHLSVKNRHRAEADTRAMIQFCEQAYSQTSPEVFEGVLKRLLKRTSAPSNIDSGQLSLLPQNPGVYIFKDKANVPLYIGKSVNIKKRVQSHFSASKRYRKSLKLSLQAHGVEYKETKSELEALLLESFLIKQQMPVLNYQLRRKRYVTALVGEVNEQGYCQVKKIRANLNTYEDVSGALGIYPTSGQAQRALESAHDKHQLCSIHLGLETGKGPCFRYQLDRCHGACIGEESASSYNQRLEAAFSNSTILPWPYTGPQLIQDTDDPSFGLVVDHWMITQVMGGTGQSNFQPALSYFDLDTYKILRSYLKHHTNKVRIEPFKSSSGLKTECLTRSS